jgi:hypothetical protein
MLGDSQFLKEKNGVMTGIVGVSVVIHWHVLLVSYFLDLHLASQTHALCSYTRTAALQASAWRVGTAVECVMHSAYLHPLKFYFVAFPAPATVTSKVENLE